jgi:hypothetical protein
MCDMGLPSISKKYSNQNSLHSFAFLLVHKARKKKPLKLKDID